MLSPKEIRLLTSAATNRRFMGREHRNPRCNESRRSGLSKARRAILPLPKGDGGNAQRQG